MQKYDSRCIIRRNGQQKAHFAVVKLKYSSNNLISKPVKRFLGSWVNRFIQHMARAPHFFPSSSSWEDQRIARLLI